jgi:hypothetical protein
VISIDRSSLHSYLRLESEKRWREGGRDGEEEDKPDNNFIKREQADHAFVRVDYRFFCLEFASHICLESLHHSSPELVDIASVQLAFGSNQSEGFLANISFESDLVASVDCLSDPIRHPTAGKCVVHWDIRLIDRVRAEQRESRTLMSSKGVPWTRSQADRCRHRFFLSTRSILARVTPMGFGLCGERVESTPTFFLSIYRHEQNRTLAVRVMKERRFLTGGVILAVKV